MVEETLGCEARGLALPLTVTLAPGLHASPLVPLLPSCHELSLSYAPAVMMLLPAAGPGHR